MATDFTLFVHQSFWKDVKELRKIYKKNFLESSCPENDLFGVDDGKVIKSIDYFNSINTYLSINKLEDVSDKLGRQPFLDKGWIIHKVRWGIDNTGKRGGVRIIFAVNSGNLIYLAVKPKKHIENHENEFQEESISRLREYIK